MQIRDGDPAFAVSDRHTRRFRGLQPAPPSRRSRQAMPLQRCRRSRRKVRGVDSRDMRTRRRGVSQSDGMFVAGRRRRKFRHSSLMRTHAQSRAELESSRARVPYAAGFELTPETRLRTRARVKYPTRYPPAYAHSPSNCGTPFPYVGDEVRCAMNRSITRTQIPARGGLRTPAESQSAPSAPPLPEIHITIVSPPHAPSIIAPW